eukprot:gene15711-7005_t
MALAVRSLLQANSWVGAGDISSDVTVCNPSRGIDENWGLWPSRIRVDYGIENVSVCDAMVVKRGYKTEAVL